MRIIFIISDMTGGGTERALANFANALVELGEDVHIISVFKKTENLYPVADGVQSHLLMHTAKSRIPIPPIRKLHNYLAATMQVRRLAGDVIIALFWYPPYRLKIWLATLFSKTKFIFAVRNNYAQSIPGSKERRMRNLYYHLAHGIWIQAENQRCLLPKSDQRKAFVVRNILHSCFLTNERPVQEKIRNFISVGRLHPQKNQKMMVLAFSQMIERCGNSDATLTIYGKALYENSEAEMGLRSLIHQLHLEDRVFLPGWTADIAEKYRAADAFVFSSNYEGCPNALMEAMAAGLPCVSTDCPTGPSLLIENGESGLLVPVGDVEAMSRAMEALIADPHAARRMGEAAQRSMRQWGGEEELAQELLNHLREICS